MSSSSVKELPVLTKVAAGAGLVALSGLAAYLLIMNTKYGRRVARRALFALFNSLPDPLPKTLPFEHRVQPHGPLEKLHEGLWVVKGSMPNMPLPRMMAVYRPPNSTSLLVYSVLCLDSDTLAELDKLGTVTYIFIPCSWHTLDASAWTARYPNAKLLAPRRSLDRLQNKVVGNIVAAEDIFPVLGSRGGGVVASGEGGGAMERSVRLVFAKGTSAQCDECELLVTLPPTTRGPETSNLIKRKDTTKTSTNHHALIINDMFHEELKLTTLSRILMIDQRAQFREWLREFIKVVVEEENVEVVTVSHGAPIVGREEVQKRMKGALSSL
ncbi:hypothetical protein HK104_010541 [Borealophlyctis nickersoniae]|nr:hypothetical protein HK104_010541 [Borealophlyctis nickersoniae]